MCSQVTWHSGGGLLTKSCLTVVTPWTVACQATLSMGFSRILEWVTISFSITWHMEAELGFLSSYYAPRGSCPYAISKDSAKGLA